jgi:hypothetical protein
MLWGNTVAPLTAPPLGLGHLADLLGKGHCGQQALGLHLRPE